jgi:hypothetical protein
VRAAFLPDLSHKHLLPGVRFAIDAYVSFARQQPWEVAASSSLTELFAPAIHQARLDNWPQHYPWIDERALKDPGRPLWLLAELTYKCPLQCPYCSNPLDIARDQGELSTEEWVRVLLEARALGAVQLGFSGDEALVRKDLEMLIAAARGLIGHCLRQGWVICIERTPIMAPRYSPSSGWGKR